MAVPKRAARIKADKAETEAAAVAAEAATPSVADPSKWALSDLRKAVVRKDIQFVPAVQLFSVRKPADVKRASELESLLLQVAKLSDDAKVPVPFAPETAAAQVPAGMQIPYGIDTSQMGVAVPAGGGNASSPSSASGKPKKKNKRDE